MTQWQELIEAYKAAKIEFPILKAITLAQWILESGRGTSKLSLNANNFGGLKYREEIKLDGITQYVHDNEGRKEDSNVYFKCDTPARFIELYWAFMNRSVYKGWKEKIAASNEPKDYLKHIVFKGYVGPVEGESDDALFERRIKYIAKVVDLIPEAYRLLSSDSSIDLSKSNNVDLLGFTVALDCGHGEDKDLNSFDPGATGNNTREYDEVVYYAHRVKELLEPRGAKVDVYFYPFGSRPKIGLGDKGAKGNGHDVFVSCHLNAANGSAQGTEVYYHPADLKSDKLLASILQKSLVKRLGFYDRGIKTARFGVFTKLASFIGVSKPAASVAMATLAGTDDNIGAVLVEPFFIDWSGFAKDKNKVRASSEIVALALADGLAEFAKTKGLVQIGTQPKPAPTSTPTPSTTVDAGARLFNFYSQKKNYDAVCAGAKKFYPSFPSNGCVAAMSEALRQSGVANIPHANDDNGENFSLVTLPFSNWLKYRLGWQLITDAKELKSGDVVFTIDAPRFPGYPAHTYMFHSWVDKTNGIGRVVDNQDFTHERNIFGYGTYNFSPFKYAFRPK